MDPSGCKFNRKRDTVQTPAYLADQRCLFFAKLEPSKTCGDPFDEKLSRGIGKDISNPQPIALRRTVQRKKPKNPFAFSTKGLPGRRENMKLRELPNHAFGQRR